MKKLLALMSLIAFISSMLASFVDGNVLFQSDAKIFLIQKHSAAD